MTKIVSSPKNGNDIYITTQPKEQHSPNSLFVRQDSVKKKTMNLTQSHHGINPIDSPDEYISKHYPGNKIIKTLQAGISFGELALIDNTLRSTSIVCRETCNFAILDKNDFKRILSLSFLFRKLLYGFMVYGS